MPNEGCRVQRGFPIAYPLSLLPAVWENDRSNQPAPFHIVTADRCNLKTRSFITFFLIACALVVGGAAHGQARKTPVELFDLAPDFTLPDQNGQKHSLSAERGKRPVVLIFYRGYW